jgi:hypothetical protein
MLVAWCVLCFLRAGDVEFSGGARGFAGNLADARGVEERKRFFLKKEAKTITTAVAG